MKKQLVFIHGRAQEQKDADALKNEWISTFEEGLAKNNLSLPVRREDIRFPYYGDTLYGLVEGRMPEDVAKVTVRGKSHNNDESRFVRAVLDEIRIKVGVSDAELAAVASEVPRKRGVLNWEWVQFVLKAIDQHTLHGSGASIALATRDVYRYLKNASIRQIVDEGVCKAVQPGIETVIVSHSLGTVVAYNILRQRGETLGWNVPLFVTVGSPLGVNEIRKTVSLLANPIQCPSCVGEWYNAMDERDVVALYPLTSNHFPLAPRLPVIENNTSVRNETENRHGISGYLSDANVAKTIYEALV